VFNDGSVLPAEELVFEGAQSDDFAGPMALTDADRDEL